MNKIELSQLSLLSWSSSLIPSVIALSEFKSKLLENNPESIFADVGSFLTYCVMLL